MNINREDFDRPCSQTQPPTSLLKDVSLPREIEPSKCRFDFLINFTRAKGLNEAYNYRSLTEQSIADCAASKDVSSDVPPLNGVEASNPFDCYSGEIEASLWKDFELSPYIPAMEADDILLDEKAFQISETLQSLIEKTPLPFETLPDLPTFFSSENIKRYLDLFWDRWYQHCPIIHRATFTLESCSSLLLAVMSLVGACMSSRQSDHDGARRILNLTEELLFSQPIFAEMDFSFLERTSYPNTIQNVQMLQAACFMCLLQKWEGDKAAKLRMQRHRFTAIVAVCSIQRKPGFVGVLTRK